MKAVPLVQVLEIQCQMAKRKRPTNSAVGAPIVVWGEQEALWLDSGESDIGAEIREALGFECGDVVAWRRGTL